MKNKFFFTAGIVGMLSGVASGATDVANKGWFGEQRPYMVLCGGWQFGKAEPGISLNVPSDTANASVKKSLKSAWAGSFEFGTSHFEDRLLCGIELGYFTGEFKLNESLGGTAGQRFVQTEILRISLRSEMLHCCGILENGRFGTAVSAAVSYGGIAKSRRR